MTSIITVLRLIAATGLGLPDFPDDSLAIRNPELWVVALPFKSQDWDKVDPVTAGDPNSLENNMAVQFYTGLRVGVDSLNQSGYNIQLMVVEHIESSNLYRIEIDGRYENIQPEAFLHWVDETSFGLERVAKIIGPFRGEASESLGQLSTQTLVINPVSRRVNTEGSSCLIVAAPDRSAELEQLAALAYHQSLAVPQSHTVVLDDGNPISIEFIQTYTLLGGDSSSIHRVAFSASDKNLPKQLIDSKYTRLVCLTDQLLVTANVLNKLRSIPEDQMELWMLSSQLSSTSLDANLLRRQPLVWVQAERLDYMNFTAFNRLLTKAARCTPGRWEWIGLDLAWLCSSLSMDGPTAFEGPRRVYTWRRNPLGGYANFAALGYRYDPAVGIQPLWLSSKDYSRPQTIESEDSEPMAEIDATTNEMEQ